MNNFPQWKLSLWLGMFSGPGFLEITKGTALLIKFLGNCFIGLGNSRSRKVIKQQEFSKDDLLYLDAWIADNCKRFVKTGRILMKVDCQIFSNAFLI